MAFREIQFKFFNYDSLTSTNIHAHELIKQKVIESDAVITTQYQSMGKGQREKVWHSQARKNLLMSIVLTVQLKIEAVYLLNKMVSLAIVNTLDKLTVKKLAIKWPNDVLVNGKKIAGILIENSIQGQKVNRSIIGIGLNVNQTEFPTFHRAATSLKIELNKAFEMKMIQDLLLKNIQEGLDRMNEEGDRLEMDYQQSLYGLNKRIQFRLGSDQIEGKVLGVDAIGRMQLEIDGKVQLFQQGELSFID